MTGSEYGVSFPENLDGVPSLDPKKYSDIVAWYKRSLDSLSAGDREAAVLYAWHEGYADAYEDILRLLHQAAPEVVKEASRHPIRRVLFIGAVGTVSYLVAKKLYNESKKN